MSAEGLKPTSEASLYGRLGGMGGVNAEENFDDTESSDVTGSDGEEEASWIQWFCSLRGSEFFCEVDEAYIRDDFNLTGLSSQVPYYDYALDMILDIDSPDDENLTEEQHEMIEASAELLYGLIHARFIITSRGLSAMYEKFRDADFGRCHLVSCQGFPMLPVGQSDVPRRCTVNLYCPKCKELYFPKSSRHADLDGAYFGTTFAHLFLLTFPELIPETRPTKYVPRIFGFRIHPTSPYWNPREAARENKERRRRVRAARAQGQAGGAATPSAGADAAQGAAAAEGAGDAAPAAAGNADAAPAAHAAT